MSGGTHHPRGIGAGRPREFIAQAGGGQCRARLASLCGYVEDAPSPAVLTITLGHIVEFIAHRLREYRPVLRRARFKDPTLSFFKLLDKMSITLTVPKETTASERSR